MARLGWQGGWQQHLCPAVTAQGWHAAERDAQPSWAGGTHTPFAPGVPTHLSSLCDISSSRPFSPLFLLTARLAPPFSGHGRDISPTLSSFFPLFSSSADVKMLRKSPCRQLPSFGSSFCVSQPILTFCLLQTEFNIVEISEQKKIFGEMFKMENE